MIGNDIVDMNDERNFNRSSQQRFLNKLFTASEQKLIASSDMPDHMVWILWSIKESAYKVINKYTGERSYAPLSYEVKMKEVNVLNTAFLESTVAVSDTILFARTFVTENFIYSNASTSLSLLNSVKWKIEERSVMNPEQQSIAIREFAKKHIAEHTGINISGIFISKDNAGVPLVYIDNKISGEVSLSLTHDGNYSAYACLLHSSMSKINERALHFSKIISCTDR